MQKKIIKADWLRAGISVKIKGIIYEGVGAKK